MDFLKDLLMGGTSGCVAKTACAPLERVKIVLQTQAADASTPKYNGMLACGQGIVKNHGVAALWRGNLVNCSRYFPTQAIGFATKAKYQAMFVPKREEAGFARWFAGFLLAGGLAGATALTVVYPLEFSYTRLAADVNNKKFTGLTDCVRKIARADGVQGLYRGYGPSVAGIIVYRAGYFGFYDAGKLVIWGEDPAAQRSASFIARFGLALCVDISAACFAYPLDTVRRRLMMQSGKAAEEVQYTSAFGAASHILKHEGAGGFFKGVFANNVRAIASALVLVLYDEMKKMMDDGEGGGGHGH